MRLHLPVLRFYLKNIDKLNLDSIATSKSVKFTRQAFSKYSQLVQKKFYRRLPAKLISKFIENMTKKVHKGLVDQTLKKLKGSLDKQHLLDGSVANQEVNQGENDEEFDLT